MSCPINEGPHTFYTTKAYDDEIEGRRVGKNEMFRVITWHTCIACGVRRGITDLGELIKKIKGEWQIAEIEDI